MYLLTQDLEATLLSYLSQQEKKLLCLHNNACLVTYRRLWIRKTGYDIPDEYVRDVCTQCLYSQLSLDTEDVLITPELFDNKLYNSFYRSGHTELCTLLLRHSPFTHAESHNVFREVVRYGTVHQVRVMTDRYPDIIASEASMFLREAASKGNGSAVKLLLSFKCSNKDLALGLVYASKDGHTEAARALLEAKWENTEAIIASLAWAARRGRTDITILLLVHDVLTTKHCTEALHTAIGRGHSGVIIALLWDGRVDYKLTRQDIHTIAREGGSHSIRPLVGSGCVSRECIDLCCLIQSCSMNQVDEVREALKYASLTQEDISACMYVSLRYDYMQDVTDLLLTREDFVPDKNGRPTQKVTIQLHTDLCVKSIPPSKWTQTTSPISLQRL